MIGMRDRLIRILRIQVIWRYIVMFCVNHMLAGTPYFEIKRALLNSAGHSIGVGTRVVGPIEWHAPLKIGENCWIGKNLKVNGNGNVIIGDNCDIAPEVTFQTGGHRIGGPERRAGEGLVFSQQVGNGVWIGGRVTILGETVIGDGSVIAGCACVIKNVPENTLVGGVPARVIRSLDDENTF